MELGYCRVSSKEQNIERQISKFVALGIQERFIFTDRASGKNFDRPQYQNMRNMIRSGDVIYIDSLDRLGRDYDGIIKEWKYITRDLQADIVCLDNSELFDSRKFKMMGEIGKLLEDQLLSTLAYVADVERKKNHIRQREGIAVAKKNGVRLGRPPMLLGKDFVRLYKEWRDGKITAVSAYKELGISATSFYKKVKTYEKSLCDHKK